MIQRSYILGNPRSGTSLLRIMLNSHPEIAAPPESGFSQWWYNKYHEWSVKDAINNARLSEFVNDLLSSKKIETWLLDRNDLFSYLVKKKPDNYGDLVLYVYLYWAKKRSCSPKLIVDKNNYYIYHLNELNKIWTESKYIFIVRDGRDVACSYLALSKTNYKSKYKPKLKNKITDIAFEWSDNNSRILDFLQSKEKTDYIIVRFEDLIDNPIETMNAILKIFDMEYNDRMIHYYNYNDEPNETIEWKLKTKQKLDPSSIGKYRDILSQEEINLYNNIAEPTLKLFNYNV